MTKRMLTPLDMSGQKVTNAGDASAGTDLVTLQQVQAFVRGLRWKDPVRAASTGNVSLTAPGATLDGVTLATNDRVLLKSQTAGAENGIYVWTGSATALTRAVDADSAAEVTGAAVTVTEGTNNADKVYTQNADAVTLGTTTLSFVQLGGAGTTYTGGNGILVTGSAITAVIDPAAGAGLLLTSAGLKVDPSVVVRKFAANVGTGAATSIAVTHNLGTLDVAVTVFDNATLDEIICDVVHTSTTVVTLGFATAPAAGAYRVVVQG